MRLVSRQVGNRERDDEEEKEEDRRVMGTVPSRRRPNRSRIAFQLRFNESVFVRRSFEKGEKCKRREKGKGGRNSLAKLVWMTFEDLSR